MNDEDGARGEAEEVCNRLDREDVEELDVLFATGDESVIVVGVLRLRLLL